MPPKQDSKLKTPKVKIGSTNENEDVVKTPRTRKPTKKAKREQNDNEEPTPKRAKTEKKQQAKTELKEKISEPKQLINKIDTDLNAIDLNCEKLNEKGKKYNFKICSWNVSGIRAVIKKKGIDYIEKEDADIIVLQETKCDKDKLPAEVQLKGYHQYFVDSKRSGYCGVGLYTKVKPINVKYGLGNSEINDEGRMITAEYENFFLINVYVPNAGNKLVTLPKRLKWNEEFKSYVMELDEKKPVIICGDMNVAHQEIDLSNPKANTKNAGFTKEEREGMTELLKAGFVDTFRALYPDLTGAYTFWSYFANARNKNIGWRLDYFLVSERIKNNVCDNVIRSKVYGSDHCPVVLYINI
ncbi:exodeoxyribonuclease-like [Prorops nasuta]|uniref:exodeoxyribonuclease-like n=1 Tax=Prorops nasuta TaxID=863751 RepID=UPI0034CED358